MKCKDCGIEVSCKEHGTEHIDEYQHEDDDSYYYSCHKCLNEGAGAFGSIIHWCKDMFKVFSDKGLQTTLVQSSASVEDKNA